MKHLLRYGGVVALLMIIGSSMTEARPLKSVTPTIILENGQIPAFVREQSDSMVIAEFGRGAMVDCQLWIGANSVGSVTDMPPASVKAGLAFINAADAAGQATMLTGTSSDIRYDPNNPTRIQKKVSEMFNILLGPARGASVNMQTMRRSRVSATPIINWRQGTLITRVNLPVVDAVTHAAFDSAIVALRDHDQLQDARLDNHEARLRNTLQKSDLGLDVSLGGSWIVVNDDQYNGPTVSFDFRYLDLVVQGVGGQSFNQSTATEWYDGVSIPKMSDNHFEGGSILWAPLQRGHWGYYYRLGVTGLHAQRINAFNDSKEQAYLAGLTGSLAIPLPLGTPEVYGTVGYGRTIHSPETDTNEPVISEGVATVIGVRLVFGRR